MPEAEGATTLEQKDLTITLAYGTDGPDGKGKVYVDSQEIPTMEELTRVLAEKVAEASEVTLLIRPDTRTTTGRLVEVFGIAQSVGITKYSISAQPPDQD